MECPDTNNCRTWRELISRAADTALNAADEARLRDHLSACAHCAAEARAGEALHELLRRDPLPLTEAQLPTGLEMARTIREAAAVKSGAGVRPSWAWAGALAAGLAAILVVNRGPDSPPVALEPQSTSVAQPAPGFWIVDDERTGRNVVVGPSVGFAGTH